MSFTVNLNPDMPVEKAIQIYILDRIADFEKIASGLGDPDRDVVVESVHDLRVDCRQILSVIDAFTPWIRVGRLDPLRREIRCVNGLLGPVRDLDVLLESPELISPFRERAEHDRRYALCRLISEMSGQKLDQCLGRMRSSLAGPEAMQQIARNPITDKGRVQQQLLGPVIPEVLYRLAARITAYRTLLDPRSPTGEFAIDMEAGESKGRAIHQLRIDCKRFRYTLTMLRPLFPDQTDAALKSFKKLQDLLGEWHDLERLAQVLGGRSKLMAGEADSSLTHAVIKRQEELMASFAVVWQTTDAAWFHRLIRSLVDHLFD